MPFSYTGAQQNFVVPKRVTQISVKASGAGGEGGEGGEGGLVKATIPVTPGESLAIFVGAGGGYGGFNGGAIHGGGGASDVRQ
ncbi:MAG: hypothetical protein WBX23_11205, partial [Candidatus Cybelea sp.]